MDNWKILFLVVVISIYAASGWSPKEQTLNIICGRTSWGYADSSHNGYLLLNDVVGDLPSNTVLELTSGTCNLTHPLKFTRVTNITIRGQGSQHTTISCHHTNAGLIFNESSNIELRDFAIDSCGVSSSEAVKLTGNVRKSVIITNGTMLVLQRLAITNSNGCGLLIANTFSNVLIDSVAFRSNKVTGPDVHFVHGGGGMVAVFMSNQSQHATNYTIINCTFEDNSANENTTKYWHHITELGGGVALLLLNNSTDIHIGIERCYFAHNSATYGGGLYVKVSDNASECCVTISESKFIANRATIYNGGGANVGFTARNQQVFVPTKNSIVFKNTMFQNNTAQIGGGVSVFTSSVREIQPEMKNNIMFDSCNFTANSANGSAAIDIRQVIRQHGPIFITGVTFKDVNFIGHLHIQVKEPTKNSVFFTNEVTIRFMNNITFASNGATALYSASALLIFEPYSTVKFLSNTGEKGGAVLLAGEARIQLSDNTHLEFINNSASIGGAICALPTQGFTLIDSCFLYIESLTGTFENVTLRFDNNVAHTGIGLNIFASSLAPCLGLCQYKLKAKKTLDTHSIFTSNCIGNFSFAQGIDHGSIATSPLAISCSPCHHQPIPGFPLHMNITQIDEMGNNVGDIFLLTATLNNVSTDVSLEQLTVLQNSVILHGTPGQSGVISIQNVGPIVRKVSISFVLDYCPPGFTVQEKACKCSNYKDSDRYFRISACQDNSALITLGFWVGYIGTIESQHTLYTGTCKASFCNFNNQSSIHGEYVLPNYTTSKEELEKIVCNVGRRGVLCSNCAKGYTMLYHSRSFECSNQESVNCSLGILLYAVSELLPVTILFLVVLIFNISLTSGALYSFILYAQILDSLFVDAFGTIEIRNMIAKQLLNVFRIVYGLFNLNMFNINGLSFCLISDANAMHLLMFQYGTVVYAVLLVIVTILLLRLHSCYCCVKLGKLCGRRNIRGSIVDGLSTFLVLCYFMCTRTTFQILTPVTLRGIGETRRQTVPLFLGDESYLGKGHLPFAIPAMFCLLIVIIPLPCILVIEPVLTKLFSLNIWSVKVAGFYTKIRMSCMPFLDSFQGSFKDKYRYFAGLYFAYRAAVIAACSIFLTVSASYISVEIILFFVLFTHAVLRPHKKLWHNILEFGIMLDLLFVNTITLLNYAAVVWGDVDSSSEVSPLVWLQIVALFLPILYLVIYAIIAAYRNIKSFYTRSHVFSQSTQKPHINSTDSLEGLGFPARMLESKADYFTF